ncbi:MAG: glycosyltransferase, partial [Nitrospinae bacterium]|nr:glycosyltransferase [Nitrospinota bacterium]
KIEAGADMFLMSSRYEPCGLNQLYSLKYGTIPIVRGTGGLNDTIENYNPVRRNGNGFKFTEYSSMTLLSTIKTALDLYRDKSEWNRLMINAMGEDFSWNHSAKEYVELYRKVINKRIKNKF